MKKEPYIVKITALKNHTIPTLLKDFSKWLNTQPYGTIGYFDFITEEIPKQFKDTKLKKEAFSFIQLPDGSMVLLSKDGPVTSLGSETAFTGRIGDNLEEFLLLLAEGSTQIDDLDASKPAGRKALKKWLEKKKIVNKTRNKKVSIATPPQSLSYKDFVNALNKTFESKEMKGLLQKLGNPGIKYDSDGYWTLKNDGVCMVFKHPEGKPISKKNEKDLLLNCVQLYDKSPENGIKLSFKGELPENIKFGDKQPEVQKKLGKPEYATKWLGTATWKKNKLFIQITYKSVDKTVVMVSLNY